jgi:serine/threonine protein kinase/Tol biopolymer transport system component
MGEVYRATDTNLKRAVAIKVLPNALASDDERLARFRREAEILASLNHPNIAAIYGLERSDDRTALVMELVEGTTLEDRIRRGAIPIEEALGIAKQIAEALEAAHERGIIHRDLKPANVKVRADGAAKVLDFGIAKAMEPAAGSSPDRSMSPTITTPAMTRAGMILGTAAYMAPEQARGNTVDRRVDIWALGCVLYEMLTGRRAFDGASTVEVISDVLKTDPEWAALPAGAPTVVRSLLRRCLQKDPSRRLRDAADARFQIEDALSDSGDAERGRATAFRAPPRQTWWVAAVIIASAAAVAVSLWFSRRSVPDPEEVRFEIPAPPTTEPTSIALSPDGKMVVFAATTDRQSRLWVRPLNAVSARPLAGTENARLPFWSPDSRSVGFAADAQLKRVDIESGAVRVLASGGALGGAWNRDGTILFDRAPGASLFRVSGEGGEPQAVTQPTPEANDHWAPQFLPDHSHYLIYATGTVPGIYGGVLGAPEPPRRIVDAQAASYASSGHLLFVRGGTLFAQVFDPVRLALAGSPIAIAEQIVAGGGPGATAALSASAAGPFAYRTGPSTSQHHFLWFDRSGAPLETIPGSGFGDGYNSSLSPDASRLATSSRLEGTADVWLLDVKRGVPTRLTTDPAFDLMPVWSPDGRRIAFTSNRNGPAAFALYMRASDGTGNDELLVAKELGPNDWSPDGRFILYGIAGLKGDRDIMALPLEGDRKPVAVVATPFNETNGQFAPDGKWIAFQSNESGRPEIYVQPFLRPGQKVRISTEGGIQARWRGDGKELFYLAPDQRLMAVPIQLDAQRNVVDVGTPVALFMTTLAGIPQDDSGRQYMVSRDGQRFLMDTRREVTVPITVVLNWKPKP